MSHSETPEAGSWVAGGAAVGLALLVRLVELVRLDAEVAGAGRHAEVRPYHAEYQRHLALIGAGVSARAGEAVRVAASGGLQRLRIGRPVPCRCRSQKQSHPSGIRAIELGR